MTEQEMQLVVTGVAAAKDAVRRIYGDEAEGKPAADSFRMLMRMSAYLSQVKRDGRWVVTATMLEHFAVCRQDLALLDLWLSLVGDVVAGKPFSD
jgi:hypothetical protein